MPYIKFQIRRFAVVVYMALILVILTSIVILKARSFTAGKAWVDHTTQVISTIQAVQSTMLNAETGQRGYIITGDESYLDSYRDALAVVNQQLASLRSLVARDPTQLARVQSLEQLIKIRLLKLQNVIDERESSGLKAAADMLTSNGGKETMDRIRGTLSQMLIDEKISMNRRLLQVDDAAFVLSVSLVIIVVRDLFVLVLIVYAIQNRDQEGVNGGDDGPEVLPEVPSLPS